MPDDVKEQRSAARTRLRSRWLSIVTITLDFPQQNAIAAYESGADILDCGLMGMARSAGNLPTEAAVAFMQKYGEFKDIDLYAMLNGIDQRLLPAMEKHSYHDAIPPYDLIPRRVRSAFQLRKDFQCGRKRYRR